MTKRKIDLDKIVYIYGLVDNIENRIKYIGWAIDVNKRRKGHIYEAKNPSKSFSPESHKNRWIRKILKEGGKIYAIILETTRYEYRNDREISWIKTFGRENLCNGTDGGESNPFVGDARNYFPSIYSIKIKLWNSTKEAFYYRMNSRCMMLYELPLSETSGSVTIDLYDEDKDEIVETLSLEDYLNRFKNMKNPYMNMSDEEVIDAYFDYQRS